MESISIRSFTKFSAVSSATLGHSIGCGIDGSRQRRAHCTPRCGARYPVAGEIANPDFGSDFGRLVQAWLQTKAPQNTPQNHLKTLDSHKNVQDVDTVKTY